MSIMSKSFIINAEHQSMVEMLTDEEAGILIKALFSYAIGKDIVVENRLVDLALTFFKRDIDDYYKSKRYGENSHLWKGGITPENRIDRTSSRNAIWRKEVFSRDNYTCQNCGAKGGVIHAHHIKHFSEYKHLRFDIENGVTLCKKCHNKIHSKNG